MKIIEFPSKCEWPSLLQRPFPDAGVLSAAVAEIISRVRDHGDLALFEYAKEFDGLEIDDLIVHEDEFASACEEVPEELKRAIKTAKKNIEKFHMLDSADPAPRVETMPGVLCWRRRLPIQRVGLYVPAGSAPLFSTVLMLAIPAKIAGCQEVIMCSPTGPDGRISAAVLYAARFCGVERVFKIGGAQAVAAMAFGTATIPRVDKIFGPGNRYVTEAKLQVMRFGAAIDMPAGPSELAVLADDSSVPAFVAADLLSQAEHGGDSQVILVATSREFVDDVTGQIEGQLEALPRAAICRSALEHSRAIIVGSIDEAISLVNEYAPEHLIVATRNAADDALRVVNAGSVFLGNFSCESAGDYASGTNHTLPTNGSVRGISGVTVESFTKSITYQQLSESGLENLGPTIEVMARAEGLEAHRRAVSIRRDWAKRGRE